ncbi:MAG: hypothetical protein IPL23_27405 [Saprospiraceae bacterium]|nr:hypothetical protein [Saprospiraceae bacterium]
MLEKKEIAKLRAVTHGLRAICYLFSVIRSQFLAQEKLAAPAIWQFGNIAMGNIAIWQCLWPVPAFARGATGFQ